jgi:hypothetical protein
MNQHECEVTVGLYGWKMPLKLTAKTGCCKFAAKSL